MKINVAQQLKQSMGNMRRYTVSETMGDGFSSVHGEIGLVLTNRSILATGEFNTTANCTCSRCLEEFQYPLKFELSEEFFPTGDILKDTPTSVAKVEEEDGFIIGEDHILDLSEALRQHMIIGLPAKSVCKPECAGLCQKGGQNLNTGQCNCSNEQSDPRWSPLRKLIEDQMVESGREVN